MSERYFVRRSQETKLCRDKLYRTIIKIREYVMADIRVGPII